MLVVPRQVITAPLGIEMRSAMIAPVALQAVPDRRRVERGDREEREMSEPDRDQSDRLAGLRRRAPWRAFVCGVVAAVATHRLMMLVIVERESRLLAPAEPMQEVLVRG